MSKVKINFKFAGIDYKNIEAYGNNITVSGTADMIRQYIKAAYPKFSGRGVIWVKSSRFANGNSIDVYFNRIPDAKIEAIKKELDIFEYYDGHNYSGKDYVTDAGEKIEFGTKYLHVRNEPPYDSKEAKEPAPDWTKILTESKPRSSARTSSKPRTSSGYSRGQIIKDCGGWEVYVKTLPDGRVVYSAYKKKETPANKEDWNAIKADVYNQSGFKWGKFGAFERWGTMTPNDEGLILTALCDTLATYYKPSGETPVDSSKPYSYITRTEYEDAVISQIELIGEMTRSDAQGIAEVPHNQNLIYLAYSKGDVKPSDCANQILGVQEGQFVYGKKWDIPTAYGNEIVKELEKRGFLTQIRKNYFILSRPDIKHEIIVNDNGGEFNLDDHEDHHMTNIAYDVTGGAVKPFQLANEIEQAYLDRYRIESTETPSVEETFVPNESYKTLPANPKLEFCRIKWAEGNAGYADTFPKDFQSFTALTQYIADNIGEVPQPGEGYDKHGVEWKWKFEDNVHTDRWDVSFDEANPIIFSNLFASESLRSLCYNALAVNGSGPMQLELNDEYYGNIIEKDGFELTDDGFKFIISKFIDLGYYKADPKRFAYNTFQDRLDRLRSVYPKLFAAFEKEEPTIDKQKIERAIKGLQYLADKGDEKAQKAITGLKHLLK